MPPKDAHWATFVRNHDELTLDKLTEAQRQEVFDAFGPNKDMQVYGRGLRRRLPPMLDGDQRRIRLVLQPAVLPARHAGAVLRRGDRHGREPRRPRGGWPSGRRCSGPSGRKRRVLHRGRRRPSRRRSSAGAFGPKHVNVEAQRPDPESLHAYVRSLVRAYRECPELGWGTFSLLACDTPSVLAHQCVWEERTLVVLHNLSDQPVTARVPLPSGRGPVQMAEPLGSRRETTDAAGCLTVRLGRYGSLWLRPRG